MLEKLTINKSLFTPGAIYFEHVHEILDLDIDIDGPIILVARWASDHSLLTASRTIKHLAIYVRTLSGIPNKILTQFAQKMMIYSIQ